MEGSSNLDARSMGKNAEDSLNFSDASFAAKLKAAFQKDLERCRPITLESLSKRGFQAAPGRTLQRSFRATVLSPAW